MEHIDSPGCCELQSDAKDCIVSVKQIQVLTGLDISNERPKEKQNEFEETPNESLWKSALRDGEKVCTMHLCRPKEVV